MVEALTQTKANFGERRVNTLKEIAFPLAMREWVKYESADDLSDGQILAEVKQRFPGESGYPTVRCIYEWRNDARKERTEARRRVWDRTFAESARFLVPKCLVSLDRALDAATGSLARAVAKEDDKAIPRLTKAVVEVASEMLTHLGAPTHETHADPEAIKREALAALMAAGKSASEAEEAFSAFAVGAVAVLGAGEGE